MNHYSDPTANRALGAINREFARYERKATPICRRYLDQRLTEQEWEAAHDAFRGIYRHVLDHTLEKEREKREKQKAEKGG